MRDIADRIGHSSAGQASIVAQARRFVADMPMSGDQSRANVGTGRCRLEGAAVFGRTDRLSVVSLEFMLLGHSGSPTKHETKHEDDSSNYKENLRKVGGNACDSSEAQERSNKSDNGKDNGPAKHKISPLVRALRHRADERPISKLTDDTNVPPACLRSRFRTKIIPLSAT
jgi:hypothetical protein